MVDHESLGTNETSQLLNRCYGPGIATCTFKHITMKKMKKIFGVLLFSAFLGITTPAVAQTPETGTTQTTDDDDDDDNGGWGLLGLLGLAGLLGLRRRDDNRLTDDRTRTTTVNR